MPKLCPLKFAKWQVSQEGYRLFLEPIPGSDCEMEGCAWWDEYTKQCAVLTNAQKLTVGP